MKYQGIREEALKNKVGSDWFAQFDTSEILGNIDFTVFPKQHVSSESTPLLWAEAKTGDFDMAAMFVQLVLTIGKARTFDKTPPPAFLGAFDFKKMAFVPYNDVQDIFYLNDFNWNVTPSDHKTREFQLVLDKVTAVLDAKTLSFDYQRDARELKKFIKDNLVASKFGLTKTRIDKNNFLFIYNKWLETVKPTIAVDWDLAKKKNIIDGDFYLADLLSQENITLKEKLFVLLRNDHYLVDRIVDEVGMFISKRTDFTDRQIAHTQFWNKYERPPKEEYWDYMVERRELLVPQDIRERKGSFFTPQMWVELSQRYLAEVLGEDWQDTPGVSLRVV